MPQYIGELNTQPAQVATTGILLTNLGTPDAPTPRALRHYLKEFLWDPRVIELPRPVWWLILHGIILSTRPRRSARLYAKIWTEEGSPLLVITRRQATALEAELNHRVEDTLHVAIGMRYGNPSLPKGLQALRKRHCRQILILPLYPQYSAVTTASSFDAIADELKTWRWIPELRLVTHYHDEAGYVRALAATVRELWEREGKPEKLLFSFHGMPKSYFLAGDPYYHQCHQTARLVANELELPCERWHVAFQSRFGREEWIQPYTNETLEAWGKSGVKSVDVICPGFAADCLETLQEIAIENRQRFLNAGGKRYRYIPALNDRPDYIRALADLAERHLQGWIVPRAPGHEAGAHIHAGGTLQKANPERERGTAWSTIR